MKLISFITLFLFSCHSGEEKNNSATGKRFETNKVLENQVPDILKECISNYGKEGVLTVMYLFRDQLTPDFDFNADIGEIAYCRSDLFFKDNPSVSDSILAKLNIFFQKREIKSNQTFIKRVGALLKNDRLLSSVLNETLSPDLFFGEIISNIKSTKLILNKYLKEGQYWGSLDEDQSCKLYYDILWNVSGLNEEDRIRFYAAYFKYASDISLSETTKAKDLK